MLRLWKSGNKGRMSDTSKGSIVSVWSGRSMFQPGESWSAGVAHWLSSIVVAVESVAGAAEVVVRLECVKMG